MTKHDALPADSPEGERKAERRAATRLPLHLQSLQMSVRLICSLLLRSSSLDALISDDERARLQSYERDGF